jgi:hypothetical protein
VIRVLTDLAEFVHDHRPHGPLTANVRVAFDGARAKGESEEEMILRHDDNLHGVDDFVADLALARRARERQLAKAPNPLCGRRFTHPRWPAQLNSSGFLVVETCACLRLSGHEDGCVCEHDIERRVYRVDDDGREHYATRPLGGRTQ